MLPILRLRPRARLAILFALTVTSPAFSQSDEYLRTGHAIPGYPGFESSVVPTRGLSYSAVGVYYNANRATNRHGVGTAIAGTAQHASVYPTLTWLSPWKIFGGQYATRGRISLAANAPNPRAENAGSDQVGFGDSYFEPLALYWSGERGGVSLRYGCWFGSGQFSPSDPNSLGKGFDTRVASLGWTYWFDDAQLWNYSLLTRYSSHGRMEGRDVRPGDDVIVDWSVVRNLNESWDVGLVGFGVFQTSRDSGSQSAAHLGYYGNAGFGVGARWKLPIVAGRGSIRLYQEFNSFNHTEGTLLTGGLNFRL
jgi:hypothetical protein